jgi:hypothetical protein
VGRLDELRSGDEGDRGLPDDVHGLYRLSAISNRDLA